MGNKHPNVTNINEVETFSDQKGTKFGYKTKRIGAPSGAKSIGCSWFELDPGKTAFPHHFHSANEESIYILEGQGEARIDNTRVNVSPGDYIALPVGPEHAHSLKNIGTVPLRYLCFSTLIPVEVVEYPDSKKIFFCGTQDVRYGFRSSPNAWIRGLIKEQPSVDYFDGEDIN